MTALSTPNGGITARVTELAVGDVIRKQPADPNLWHVLAAYETADRREVVVRMRRESDDAYSSARWPREHVVVIDCRSSLMHKRTPDLGDVVRYRACSLVAPGRTEYHDVDAVVVGRWQDPRRGRMMVKVRPRGTVYVGGRERIASMLIDGEPVMPLADVAIVANAAADAGESLLSTPGS